MRARRLQQVEAGHVQVVRPPVRHAEGELGLESEGGVLARGELAEACATLWDRQALAPVAWPVTGADALETVGTCVDVLVGVRTT